MPGTAFTHDAQTGLPTHSLLHGVPLTCLEASWERSMRNQSTMSLPQWRWHSRAYRKHHALLKYFPLFSNMLCILGKRVNAVPSGDLMLCLACLSWKSARKSLKVAIWSCMLVSKAKEGNEFVPDIGAWPEPGTRL